MASALRQGSAKALKGSGRLSRSYLATAASAQSTNECRTLWSAKSGEESKRRSYGFTTVVMAGTLGVTGGVLLEKEDQRVRGLAKTTGFRACCDTPLTEKQKTLADDLTRIVGGGNVKKNVDLMGSRLGRGTAMLVVKPGTLEEAQKTLQACVDADVAIIPQGANTALTGASVPRNDASDRPTVVLNMRRLNKIIPIGEGEKVLCFAGTGIYDLQDVLKTKFGRDSHSVLGSIFLNPSTAAGVAFGSGGTQIRKGPAFTERALWCKVLPSGEVKLENTLGLKVSDAEIFSFLESKDQLSQADVDPKCTAPASFPNYPESLTKLDKEPSRFNADTRGIDPNRSEGKVMILATIHDTWPIPTEEKRVWVSCKTWDLANRVKREVCISSPKTMARSCEYFNREIFEATDKGGRICIEMINLLGMRPIAYLWDIKRFIETLPVPFASIFPDKCMWWFNNLMPRPLPKTLDQMGQDYDHHLLIDFSEYSPGEVAALHKLLDNFVSSVPDGDVKYHMCEDASSKARANLFRFVMAIAFRVYTTGKGMQGLSVDYAWPKNGKDLPVLPDKYPIAKRCVYSHFGCNVYHEDFVFGPEVNVEEAKHAIKHAIEEQGGRLPAEHGHGTEYHAPPATQKRWMRMDPLNVMNPGVGGTPYSRKYADSGCSCCH
eukprot:CAMPEP_0178422988 /NCGR_PEP_ID=MMETSP0689_2-20121128/27459_1 /TAXON_ID=160604 /ORGANISM="Amphidinium massartii, Strain CS-259" /LENGTH=660 /DNA_ID=CAMNT_0020044573 /DNA_START=67 /DNA_END=2049 /DNA_ORIENTATION=-